MDYMEYIQKKLGADRVSVVMPRLIATGKEEGINFVFEGKRVGATLLSHRLLKHVEKIKPELSNRMVDVLFHSYFELQEDITDLETLAKLAGQAGMDGDEVRRYLLTKEDESVIQNEIINAYRKGIDSVPHFLIDDQYAVSGAEKPTTFLQVFKRLGVY